MNSLSLNNKKEKLKIYIELANKLNGSFAEVGVYKGDTAELLAHFKSHHKKLFLFDTFDGLPTTSKIDSEYKKGQFKDTNLEAVKKRLEPYNDVEIYKGIFPKHNFNFVKDEIFSLVHLDVKLYKSYKDCLSFFYPRMVRGGILVINDYLSVKSIACKRAVDEYFENKSEIPIWSAKPQVCIVKQRNLKKKINN